MSWKFWQKSRRSTESAGSKSLPPASPSTESGSAKKIRRTRRLPSFPNAAFAALIWGTLNIAVPALILAQGLGLVGGNWSPRALVCGSTLLAGLGVWAASCYARACRGEMFTDPPHLPALLTIHPVLAFVATGLPAGVGGAIYLSLMLGIGCGYAVYAWCGWFSPGIGQFPSLPREAAGQAEETVTNSAGLHVNAGSWPGANFADAGKNNPTLGEAFEAKSGPGRSPGNRSTVDAHGHPVHSGEHADSHTWRESSSVLPLPDEAEEESPTSWLTRSTRPDQPETIAGGSTVSFRRGQKAVCVHVAFVPPLAQIPEISVTVPAAAGVRVQTRIYTYGVRFELKRGKHADEPLCVPLEFKVHGESARDRAVA